MARLVFCIRHFNNDHNGLKVGTVSQGCQGACKTPPQHMEARSRCGTMTHALQDLAATSERLSDMRCLDNRVSNKIRGKKTLLRSRTREKPTRGGSRNMSSPPAPLAMYVCCSHMRICRDSSQVAMLRSHSLSHKPLINQH